LLFICPKLRARADLEAVAAELAMGTDELSATAEGPETFCEAPTIIGVGDTRGTAAGVSLTVGIVFVTTTLTGVGVGSAIGCARAGRLQKERNKATQKSFVFIDSCSGLYYLRVSSWCGLWRARLTKDSLINKKVVKLKTFIYINHKDKLCTVACPFASH
jgi:hypothetical protein